MPFLQSYPAVEGRRRRVKNRQREGGRGRGKGECREEKRREKEGGECRFLCQFCCPLPPFPEVCPLCYYGTTNNCEHLGIERQIYRFISHFSKTVTLSVESEGETSVRGKEKNWNKSRHSPPAYVSPSRSPFLSYPLSPTFATSPPSFDGWV